MGKARILSGGSDGLYTVERIYDRTFYEQERADLEAEIADIDSRLEQANDQLDAIEAQAAEADQTLKEAQDRYIESVRNRSEDPDVDMDRLERVMQDAAEIYIARAGLKNDIALMEAAKLSAEKRVEQMDAVADPPPESAWCADLTEDASGDVATIEIPGEPSQPLIVAPQQTAEGEHAGTLMPREWMTGPQAFFNAAILPGWQRWMPTFRAGVIQSVDEDANTCTVQIQGAFSSAQDLYVNSLGHGILPGTPVRYMDCDASAFRPGDSVVVRFLGDWDGAMVIGFTDNPGPCPFHVYYRADSGLSIVGEQEQNVLPGEDTTQVEAVPDDPLAFFTEWSDGRTDNPRSDENVKESFTVWANAGFFPESITLEAYRVDSDVSGYGASGYGTQSGSLETGLTDTFNGSTDCDPKGELLSFEASCRPVDGYWSTRTGKAFPSDFEASWTGGRIYDPETCLREESGGTYGTIVLDMSGFGITSGDDSWRYSQVNVVRTWVPCDGEDPGHPSTTGTQFRIKSSDWGRFWGQMNYPTSVTLTHTATGETRTYYSGQVNGNEMVYTPQ